MLEFLRVQVERIVRPVKASSGHKDRMRDELLAHLVSAYEQELMKTNDEESAATNAVRRLGDVNSLSSELQETVAWPERWAFVSFPTTAALRRRLDEPPVQYSLRTCYRAGVFISAMNALMAFIAIVARSQQADRIELGEAALLILYFMGMAAIQFAGLIFLGRLSEAIRNALARRAVAETRAQQRSTAWQIVGFTLMGSAVWGFSVVGLMLLVEVALLPFIDAQQFWTVASGAAVVGVPLTFFQAWYWTAATDRFANWESLDIDEHKPA